MVFELCNTYTHTHTTIDAFLFSDKLALKGEWYKIVCAMENVSYLSLWKIHKSKLACRE